MLGNWNLQFENLNSQRRYPLTADATATDTTGSFKIPDSFLIELDLPVGAGTDVDPARVFVRALGAFAGGYSLVIGYQPASGDPITVANAAIPASTHVPNTLYALGGVGAFSDSLGKVLIGRLDDIAEQPPGFWSFTLAATRLEPDAVRPMIRGITAIICVNGDQVSDPLQGDVKLVAGTNVRLTPVIVAGQDPAIRIDAIQGEGTVDPCVCDGAAAPPPITRIQGVTPTADGDFFILGGDCITIEPIPNGVRITDTCSKPCCGCAELERVTSDLERLQAQAASVQEFVGTLATQVNTMSTTVLGARLGDRGCVVCA
jgi:hypothetical protein